MAKSEKEKKAGSKPFAEKKDVEKTSPKSKKQLEYWIKMALDYNPIAKQSKKKAKKSSK